jgi:hypothetical protein
MQKKKNKKEKREKMQYVNPTDFVLLKDGHGRDLPLDSPDKIIAKVQQLKLTKDVPLWAHPTHYTVEPGAKPKLSLYYAENPSDYRRPEIGSWTTTNEFTVPEIWFQIVFALYEANAKYGISFTSTEAYTELFRVKKTSTKQTLKFALGSFNNKYDYFEVETAYRVLIDPPTIEKKTNPFLTQLSDLVTVNDPKFAKEFNQKNPDFGGGIPWGLSLALFHPVFKDYYKGEQTGTPAGDVMFIQNGHSKNWLDAGVRSNEKAIDDLYVRTETEVRGYLKQEKTYKLEDFKDIITSLLDLYKEADQTTTTKNQMITSLKDVYSKLQTKHDSNLNVENLGEIKYFTTAKDTLISKDKFTPAPNGSTGTYDKGRAKGFVVLMLHIIGQITKQTSSSNFAFSSKIATKLGTDISSGWNFDESANLANFTLIITAFDDYFRGAANKVKALQDRYSNLLAEYNAANTKMTTSGYERRYPLPKQNLDDAKALVDSLNESNVLAQESAVDAKLKQVEKDAETWRLALAKSQSEQVIIDKAGADLSDAQNEWNKLLKEFKTETGSDYTKPNPSWPDINDMIKAPNPTDFTTQASLFDTRVKSIRTLEIKNLRAEIEAARNAKDALPKITISNFGSNILNIAKKSDLKARVNKESDAAFALAKENVDAISNDPVLLEGLLHALWGKDNNNKQAVTAGLFRAFL